MSVLTPEQRSALRAVCDTVMPRLPVDPDPHGLWATAASDVGADAMLADVLAAMPEDQRTGLLELLDAVAEMGVERASQPSREQMLRNIGMLGPEAQAGVSALVGLTLFLAYGAPIDPQTGQNPLWRAFGYPGPIFPPRSAPKPISPLVPDGEELALEADVVVVGSGAGGGVIAGTLAARGAKVVVLEAGGQFDDADFPGLELWAYQNLYWRGGPTPTGDMNVSLQAGFTLGGGTTVNWTNCLRTKPWVREQWAREFGLEGVDGGEFDRHLDAVLGRIGATDACSDLNGPQQRMREAAERLGWSWATVVRNTDPERYDPVAAGYMGFGDPTGAKHTTVKTFLADAVEHGADVVVRCWAERVVLENGRAAGVEARYADPETGRSARVVVRAPHVVVAGGALESPALLLRSGIGGPAVGDYLRLHPCTAVIGLYDSDQQAWWGPPHAGIIDEFADLGDGYGFLIEATQYAPGLAASAVPWTSAREHKRFMSDFRFGATTIGLLRDHGHGRVTIDHNGQAVPWYSLSDPRDVRNTRLALAQQARVHEAAGAREIYSLATGLPRWRRGDDLAAFVARAQRVPLRAGGQRLFSAHQMGTCRMGSDPATSVAGPFGELHDARGVWIGDGSAFPTPSGTNPMVSIMALAHRTAEAIAASANFSRAPLQAARS